MRLPRDRWLAGDTGSSIRLILRFFFFEDAEEGVRDWRRFLRAAFRWTDTSSSESSVQRLSSFSFCLVLLGVRFCEWRELWRSCSSSSPSSLSSLLVKERLFKIPLCGESRIGDLRRSFFREDEVLGGACWVRSWSVASLSCSSFVSSSSPSSPPSSPWETFSLSFSFKAISLLFAKTEAATADLASPIPYPNRDRTGGSFKRESQTFRKSRIPFNIVLPLIQVW